MAAKTTKKDTKAIENAANVAKRTTAKKTMKVKAYIEFDGRQVEEKAIIASVKKVWTRSGKRVGDIKTLDLYIKPEEDAAYYVINGKESGSVAL